jgi:DNA-directed RNA polymerase alpha subunit
MANTSSLARADIDAIFLRALVKTARQFAPSNKALERAILENSMAELNVEQPVEKMTKRYFEDPPVAVSNGPRKYTRTRKALLPSSSIVELTAGMRRNRSLEKHGIHTLEDLSRFSETELNELDGVGGKMIARAKELLAKASLSLRG